MWACARHPQESGSKYTHSSHADKRYLNNLMYNCIQPHNLGCPIPGHPHSVFILVLSTAQSHDSVGSTRASHPATVAGGSTGERGRCMKCSCIGCTRTDSVKCSKCGHPPDVHENSNQPTQETTGVPWVSWASCYCFYNIMFIYNIMSLHSPVM